MTVTEPTITVTLPVAAARCLLSYAMTGRQLGPEPDDPNVALWAGQGYEIIGNAITAAAADTPQEGGQ